MTVQQSELRVSVIVPVYNTGEYIEPLLASLAAQTLPADQFEVIFADDGSTDATPERLARFAAEHPNVAVLRLPNSGWPGRPRNAGIDAARGEYVFFVDHDDWLGTEALERMSSYGRANDADIVIGRYAGHRRTVAKLLFDSNRPVASLATAPLIDSLTPHKMFRRAFLDRNGLRFPEGRRRLEDHVFVLAAYFATERVSVLGDYHCYVHIARPDQANAGFQRIDPAGYYGNVREVVQLTVDKTQPGRLRDALLRRTLRTEMLLRLSGRSFLEQGASYRRALFGEVRSLLDEQFPLSVDAGLAPPQRAAAWLIRQDRQQDLEQYGLLDIGYRAQTRLTDLRWTADGLLHLEVEAALVAKDTDRPWSYLRAGERLLLPAPAATDPVPAEVADCTDRIAGAKAQLVLVRREDSQEWRVHTTSEQAVHQDEQQAWLSYRASATVDPFTVAGGEPLAAGIWDVYVAVTQAGWSARGRLGARRADGVGERALPALLAGKPVVPYWTDPHDNLSVHMAANRSRLGRAAEVTVAGRRLIATMPLFLPPDVPREGRFVITGERRAHTVPVRWGEDAAGTVTVSGELPRLASGQWRIGLRIGSIEVPLPTALEATGGTLTLVPVPAGARPPQPARRRPRVWRTLRHTAGRIRRAARRPRPRG
jgi:glycosyltransferase involved in cell wall biosynthesis